MPGNKFLVMKQRINPGCQFFSYKESMALDFSLFRFPATLLMLVFTAGCSFTQPVVEVTARTAISPLPLSLDRLEAQRLCKEHLQEIHTQITDQERTTALNNEVASYQALVEESLIYRVETVRLVERIRTTLDQGETIPGHDLTELNEGLSNHLVLRKKLFHIAEAHECWLTESGSMAQLTAEQRLKGIMISLSAALILYDNYLLAISLYQEEPRLRMLLNNKDVGYGIDYGELNRVALSFSSEENRNRVRQGIGYYEDAILVHKQQLEQDKYLFFLDQLINQSPSYSMTKSFSPLAYLGRKIGFYVPFTVEALLRLKNEGVGLTSMIFGNTVGLVESRRGRLYGHEVVARKLSDELKAGDILVERTPFRLTNTFIPGYWGHAAIWIGRESELKDLGIWDHPLIAPYHDGIRKGRRIIEALRPGVELNSIEDFLNVDDLAVIRVENMDPGGKAEAILQAFRQMGKRYDFNFDVETRDTVSCAELVYHAYGRIDWQTKKRLGRATITPDDIASKALGDSQVVLLSLYKDGERMSGDLKQVLEEMMAQQYEVNASGFGK